jgi:hypothetical protein
VVHPFTGLGWVLIHGPIAHDTTTHGHLSQSKIKAMNIDDIDEVPDTDDDNPALDLLDEMLGIEQDYDRYPSDRELYGNF